jgi:predicted CXXCH cytochrome family protein
MWEICFQKLRNRGLTFILEKPDIRILSKSMLYSMFFIQNLNMSILPQDRIKTKTKNNLFMKTNLSLAFILLITGFSLTVNAQIATTAHDFSGKTWAPADNKMCAVCHATHQAKNEPAAPLWNHQSTAVASYTLYSSPTFDIHGGLTKTNPSGSSKLCLSCHDGTVALENFGAVTTGTNYITAANKIGASGDMSKEHPISFTYNDALAVADPGLQTPSTKTSGLGGTVATDLLFAGKMECASCHDVHNRFNVPHLLKMSNTSSALCLTCHKK